MWVGLGQLVIHGLSGDMFLPQKRRENEFALAGELELVLAEMLLQYIHFICEFPGRHPECLQPGVIKNENALCGQGASN